MEIFLFFNDYVFALLLYLCLTFKGADSLQFKLWFFLLHPHYIHTRSHTYSHQHTNKHPETKKKNFLKILKNFLSGNWSLPMVYIVNLSLVFIWKTRRVPPEVNVSVIIKITLEYEKNFFWNFEKCCLFRCFQSLLGQFGLDLKYRRCVTSKNYSIQFWIGS